MPIAPNQRLWLAESPTSSLDEPPPSPEWPGRERPMSDPFDLDKELHKSLQQNKPSTSRPRIARGDEYPRKQAKTRHSRMPPAENKYRDSDALPAGLTPNIIPEAPPSAPRMSADSDILDPHYRPTVVPFVPAQHSHRSQPQQDDGLRTFYSHSSGEYERAPTSASARRPSHQHTSTSGTIRVGMVMPAEDDLERSNSPEPEPLYSTNRTPALPPPPLPAERPAQPARQSRGVLGHLKSMTGRLRKPATSERALGKSSSYHASAYEPVARWL
ncbi:hypothetical protein JCM10207_007126 [Rhodosporidiobolus poonsookiae]